MQGIFANLFAVATRTDLPFEQPRQRTRSLRHWDAPRHWHEGVHQPWGQS